MLNSKLYAQEVTVTLSALPVVDAALPVMLQMLSALHQAQGRVTGNGWLSLGVSDMAGGFHKQGFGYVKTPILRLFGPVSHPVSHVLGYERAAPSRYPRTRRSADHMRCAR